ncbi:MAG: hypothetical protein ACE5QW_09450 [Thermoplasmata archaeon]
MDIKEASAAYPNIDWCFELRRLDKRKTRGDFLSEHPLLFAIERDRTRYLDGLENLLKTLKPALPNLKEKFDESWKAEAKFDPFLTELEVAKYFLDRGKNVNLILDSETEGKSVDLRVSDDLREVYVEVGLMSDDSTTTYFVEQIRDWIRANDLKVRIDLRVSVHFSTPSTNGRTRARKEKKAKHELDEFIKTFEKAKGSVSTIQTENVTLSITRTSDRGYPGIVEGSVVRVPEEEYRSRIEEEISRRAQKGGDLDGAFVIALANKLPFVGKSTFSYALYGTPVAVDIFPQIDVRIQRAYEEGWEGILEETGLWPRLARGVYPENWGIYLRDSGVPDVNGTLVFLGHDMRPFYFANPFASDEKRDTSLEEWIFSSREEETS